MVGFQVSNDNQQPMHEHTYVTEEKLPEIVKTKLTRHAGHDITYSDVKIFRLQQHLKVQNNRSSSIKNLKNYLILNAAVI
jgi:hypothetical protein